MPGSNYTYSTGEFFDSPEITNQNPTTYQQSNQKFTIPGYLQQSAPKLNTTFPKLNFSQFNIQQSTDSIPAAYKTKTFDRDAKLKEMYGTNASKKDIRKFNKYWNSDQRYADQNAFEAQEHQNYMDNLDARWKAIGDKVGQQTTTSVAKVQNSLNSRQPIQQTPQQPAEQPKASFNTNYWLSEAQRVNPNFKSIDDVIAWQKENSLAADGKFGKASRAKWDSLQAPAGTSTKIINSVADEDVLPTVPTWKQKIQNNYYSTLGNLPFKMQGGQINKHQQGGAMQNEQELQKAFMAYLIEDAAAQGMQIQSEQDLQAYAQQLGEEGLKAKYQEFMQKMQGGVKAALGAKLNYIHKLKGNCPEGEELVYMKQGGRVCPVCQKKAEKAKSGDKLQKKNAVSDFKEKRKQINPNDTVNTKFGPRDLNGKTKYPKYNAKKENYDFETRKRVQEKDEKSGKKVIGSACGSKMKKK